MMIKHCVLILGFAVALSAFATDFMLKNGMTDWTDGASYTNGTVPTAKTDRIFTEQGATNRLKVANAKYGASFDILNTVGQVQLGLNSFLEIEVALGDTKTITGRVGNIGSATWKTCGTLIKTGAGTLLQEPVEKGQYWFAAWRVEAGTLGGPCSKDNSAGNQNFYSFGLDLAAGTHFINSYSALLQFVGPVTGSGDISTVNPARQGSAIYLKGPLGDFAGEIGANLTVHARASGANLTGVANKFDGNLVVGGFKDDGTIIGSLGFVKFGSSASDDSSLGHRGTISLGETYSNNRLSGALRYLGTTGETIASKGMLIGYTDDAPATFDAGAYGGLSFGSGVSWTIAENRNQRLCLTGSNQVECVFAGVLTNGNSVASYPGCDFYLIKRGSGIWRLKKNANSGFAGPVRVEDGVLRCDSLANRGELCALGYATRLFDDACVAPADATTVDYAILFGGVGRGLIEYTGDYDAASLDRPVAVKTGGGFSTTAKPVRVHGITAYDETTKAAEFVIQTTDGAISTYSGLSDGAKGGSLGVTKRGAGTAEIDGDLSFSGPLKVEAGKLVVRDSNGPYTWFRLVVKQNYAGQSGKSTTQDDLSHVIVERFALYDADGVRQNVAFKRHDGNLQIGGFSTGHVVNSPASCIRPGEVAYDRLGSVNCWSTRDIQSMCDVTTGSAAMCYTRYQDAKAALSPNEPESWVKYVFRLTNGTPEIAAWDVATRFASSTATGPGTNGCRVPTMLEIEGSVDGVVWDSLTNYVRNVSEKPVAAATWYSDDETGCYYTTRGNTAKIFPLRGHPETPTAFNVLGNCESVQVAPGAVLEKVGAGTVTLKGIVASKDGFGTIDGFAFAEEGVLTVENAPASGKFTIPGTFVHATDLGNLANWTVNFGSTRKNRKIVATESGLKIVPDGMCIILR